MSYENQHEGNAFLRIVFTTFLIIASMTGLNFLFIFNSVGVNPLSPIERTIASIPKLDNATKDHVITPVIEVNCLETLKNKSLSTKASSVRFLFRNCQKVESIINQSNQNQGGIFPLEKNLWTSDFIILNNGQNSIKAHWANRDQVIEVNKEKSNSKDSAKAL